MNSMTGYGRGESLFEGLRISIELSSVNRKQAEFYLSLPRELESLENRIRERLTQSIARGRVNFRLSVDYGRNRSPNRLKLNGDLARQYLQEIQRLGKALKLDSSVSIDTLLRAPGVIELHSPLEDPESLWSAVSQAIDRSLTAFLKMRAKEGSSLSRDLQSRIRLLRKSAGSIAKLAPDVVVRHRSALVERIQTAGLSLALDDERLVKEVVLFADRTDITEELTRLESHFAQFKDCLTSSEPVGRKLDFLVQEMNREINTIGSKANDSAIGSLVIEMKAELERFREQAQNVE
jgi:uncharacterized protein (TIGR00255 family)